MKTVPQTARKSWQPQPVQPPTVDPDFLQLNGVQRAAESFRYSLLSWEHWASPSGQIREWLRHNTRVGAWLLIPVISVTPVVGLLLRQLAGWLTMLMSIAGRLIALPILILLAFVVIKIVVALFKR